MDDSVEGRIPSGLVAGPGRQLIVEAVSSNKATQQVHGHGRGHLKPRGQDACSATMMVNEPQGLDALCSMDALHGCAQKVIRLHGKPVAANEDDVKLSMPLGDRAEHEACSDASSVVSGNSQTCLLEEAHQGAAEKPCHAAQRPMEEDCKTCSSPSQAIDEFDAANEESFTLESFANLIANAHVASKSFILARVTTADPQDTQKLYYSYYDAQHINKVLFRTQPEASLLHRMRARNPLNNMPVLGDVEYYIISPESVRDAHRQAKKRAARQIILSHLKSDGGRLDPATLSAFYYSEESETVNEALIQRSVSASDIASVPPPRMPLEWLGLERPCQLPPRSMPTPPLSSSSDTMDNAMAASYVARPTLLSLSYPDLRLDQSMRYLFCPLDDAMRRVMSPTTTMHAKLEGYKAHVGEREDGNIVDEHGHGHGRENESENENGNDNEKKTDIVSTAPVSLAVTAMAPSPLSLALDDKVNTVVYHAIYYGNDDDFLMKGHVREFFKLNSVQPEDAALFTLYRPANGSDASGARGRGGLSHGAGHGLEVAREPRSCLNLCGFLSNRSTIWRRNTMGGIVLVYIAVSVLVVLMGIPESLRGLVGISLLVLLALMIIIFIDTERTHSAAESMRHLPPV